MASKNPSARVEPEIWARKTANRLRLIQASFLDQGEDQRRLYIEEEIEFALEETEAAGEEDRRRFLDCLEDCFPVFVDASAAPLEEQASASDPVEPVDAILARLPSLDDEGRQRVLAALGVEPGGHATGGEALAARFTARIRMPEKADELDDFERGLMQLCKEIGCDSGDDSRLEFNRLVKLLGILGSAVCDLHRFIWEFWRQTASRDLQSSWRNVLNGPLDEALRDYLLASGEIGSREVAAEIERTKRLMLAICFAVRRGAEEFGRSHHQVFAPDNIENAVLIEQNAADAAKVRDLSRKSWEKYRQLCRHLTPDSIDSEFGRIFSSVISSWLRSRT